ncbi:hypothetical protein KEH51_23860 [[Brevibacterium] frigoritolerans]|uniref:Uncharacterized protein n=1 Tax=Peribacillus frigoritolerans TaxID=450367 RepID=A0A941FQR5_9BACI|nr:hypothetical protein [Peribacillus frigoritolerans]
MDQLPSESWYKQIFLVYLPAGIINTAKQLLLQEVVVWLLWIAKDILMQERSSSGDNRITLRTKYREDCNNERDQN